MDRFSWSDGVLTHDEQLVCRQTGVRLYDGQDKASTVSYMQWTTECYAGFHFSVC